MLPTPVNVLKRASLSSTARLAGALLSAMLLAACVTETHHSVYSKEVTKDSAIQSHVDASMEYLRKGDTENAIRHLSSARAIDKKSPVVNNGLALAFQMSGEKELAEKHYKEALRSDSRMTSARNNYAVFLYGEERYAEACKQMRKVMDDSLYEGRADAFQNLGQCELRLGNLEAAEEAFERAIALSRMQTPALLELANINLQQGDYTAAQNYYKTYRMAGQQSARSLYIGIKLADYFDDEDERASYALALKNMYPHSEEYIRYKNENSDDAN